MAALPRPLARTARGRAASGLVMRVSLRVCFSGSASTGQPRRALACTRARRRTAATRIAPLALRILALTRRHAIPPAQCGADYTLLRDLLAAGEWQKADDETRLKLCQLAGEEAEAREWVYFTEVKEISATDLTTIDLLWRAHSANRYGFSVQRALYLSEKRKWGGLFKRIGWTMGESGAYRKFPNEFLWTADAPKGHLPLTNCLRGTQLFAAVLEHPAFGGALEARGVRANASGGVGSTLGGGGPPPLEALEPGARAALTGGVALLVLLGLFNQG